MARSLAALSVAVKPRPAAAATLLRLGAPLAVPDFASNNRQGTANASVRSFCPTFAPLCCLIPTASPLKSSTSRHLLTPSTARPLFPAVPSVRRHSLRSLAAAATATARGSPPTERLVQHLLVPADQLQLLLDIQRRVQLGEMDLSDAAAEHSACASRKDGGMLGWVARGQLHEDFEEAAFSAPLGSVVRTKTQFGWHLLQALEERPASLLEQVEVAEFARRLQADYRLPLGAAEGPVEDGVGGVAEGGKGEEGGEGRRPVQLIDVREPMELEEARLPHFLSLPLSRFGKWGPTVSETLDPHVDTYVLCHHGVRSQQTAQWLQSQGFSRLYNISGGIDAYSRLVDPSVPRY